MPRAINCAKTGNIRTHGGIVSKSRNRLFAPKGPWILAGGASHRNELKRPSGPGRGGGLRLVCRPFRAGPLCGCGSGGWRHRLISVVPSGTKTHSRFGKILTKLIKVCNWRLFPPVFKYEHRRRAMTSQGSLLRFAPAANQSFCKNSDNKTGAYFNNEALVLFHARLRAGALGPLGLGGLRAADPEGRGLRR